MCLGAVLKCNPNAICEEKNPSPPICSKSIYDILAWFPLADCMVGTLSYAENQATMSHRKRGEATCSQPASSRLIFLFPLMPPWEPCQLPLWKQLLIALAQIRTSSTVPSKITLQCCSGILGRVTKKIPILPPSKQVSYKLTHWVKLTSWHVWFSEWTSF